MKKYQEIDGNLLDLFDENKFDIIVHGCNCQKMMGAGIALQIKKRYPEVYETDRNDDRSSIDRLGNILPTLIIPGFNLIINLYSQYNLGNNLDYEALTLGLRKLNHKYCGMKIGLPQIGCGIAGGNWNKVKKIIKKELKDCIVTIVNYKKN